MRSFLMLTAVAAATTWVVLRHVPVGDAEAQPPAAKAGEVQSVSLDGGRELPLAALREVIGTHVGEQLDANRIVLDRAALETALEARGYLAARVEPASVIIAPMGGAYITFDISPGPAFKLRDVKVTGTTVDASVVTLAAGDDAVAARIEGARATLEDNLSRRGKPANVTVAQHVDTAANAVDVELIVR